MNLEKQVCTLKQAIRLENLGVLQDPLFFWEVMKQPVQEGCASQRISSSCNSFHPIKDSVVESRYAAFTSAELGNMLGRNYTWFDGLWHCGYEPGSLLHMSGHSEAEVKAAELIMRMETESETVEVINERLKN